MRRTGARLSLILFFLCPAGSFAWNYTGHVLIAQIAYDQLTPEKKAKANELAGSIFKQLPPSQQEKLNNQYPTASKFAKVAILPDVWRKWNLSTIFLKFHAFPPMTLLTSLNESTANWHFIDTPYPQNKHCHIQASKNISWAIANLENSIPTAKFQTTKALEVVFLEHYIGDIHQPLHTVTNVSLSCEGDRGGNDFCLRENKYGKCTKNLHSLWDSGVGYLRPHENIQQLAYKLEQAYPANNYIEEINIKDQSQWARINLQNMNFIYSTPVLAKPSAIYYRNGQAIAKSQIVLAGYRLAEKLNFLLN